MPRTGEATTTTPLNTGFVPLPLYLGLAACVSFAMAESKGSFAATGDMTTPRTGHTATLLTNGKVLIAGGNTRSGVLASAELYDSVTGTFTATGNMSAARLGHSATLLADGSVLIAGGFTSASAELYDPVTGTFTATGAMIRARSVPVATFLGNGKVLITGGGAAEIYDPAARTFATTGAYAGEYGLSWGPDAPYVYASTLLADGQVLLSASTGFEARKELYNPRNGTFSVISPPGCDGTTATLLTNGKVLLAGGDGLPCFFDVAELYDPPTRTITATYKMTSGRNVFTATLVPNGTVLMAGGQQYPSVLGTAELYDSSDGTLSAVGNMTMPRFGHTATLLPDGRILIAGGSPSLSDVTSSAELYTPALLMAAPVVYSFSGGQGAILHTGTALVASSNNPAAVGDVLEIYCTGLIDESPIPPQIVIGGQMAEVLYFGKAPGFPRLIQVNVRVPSGVAAGPVVPVRLNYLGRPSNEVPIAVR